MPFNLTIPQEVKMADAADLLLRKWAAEAGIDLVALKVTSVTARAVLAVLEAYLDAGDQEVSKQVSSMLKRAV